MIKLACVRNLLVLIFMMGIGIGKASAVELSSEEADCARTAAASMQVPYSALAAIRRVEGGQTGKLSWNTNGTADAGPWQINSTWFETLKKFEISPDLVIGNTCVNAMVAAWILRVELTRARGDLALALGRYHSPTDWRAQNYRKLLLSALPN